MSKEFKIGKHLFKEKKVGKKHYVIYDGGEIPIPAKLTRGNVDKIADYIRRMFKKQKKMKLKKKVSKQSTFPQENVKIMKANKILRPVRRYRQPAQIEVKQEKKETVEHKGLPKIPNEYKIHIEGIPKRFKANIYHHGLPKSGQIPAAEAPKLKEGKFEKEGKESDKKKKIHEEPIVQKTGIHHFGPSGKIVKMKSPEPPSGPSGMAAVKGELVKKGEQPKEAKAGPKVKAAESAEERLREAKRIADEEREEELERLREDADNAADELMEEEEEANRQEARENKKMKQQLIDHILSHDEGVASANEKAAVKVSEISRELDNLIGEMENLYRPAPTPVGRVLGLQEAADADFKERKDLLQRDPYADFKDLGNLSSRAHLYVQDAAPTIPLTSFEDLQEIADAVAEQNAAKMNREIKRGGGIPEVQPLSLSEIQGMMQKVPGYLGTVMSDQLESLPWNNSKDCCCIFNKSKLSDNDNGTHWESILLSPDKSKSLEIYDSLAMPVQGHVIKQMENVIKRMNLPYELKLKTNGKRDQLIHKDGNSTNSCGFFAMEFLNKRADGKKFSDASGFGNPTDAEKALIPIEKRFKYLSLRDSKR